MYIIGIYNSYTVIQAFQSLYSLVSSPSNALGERENRAHPACPRFMQAPISCSRSADYSKRHMTTQERTECT